jgi:hypothetical protein
MYGVLRFLADIDAGRQFWSEGDSIVHSVLTWIVEEGFREFFSQHDVNFTDAADFRQRHMINALKKQAFLP